MQQKTDGNIKMSDDIVERVAAIIAAGVTMNLSNEELAISAIATMREPTEAMLGGATNNASWKLVAKAFWQAMIDEALK